VDQRIIVYRKIVGNTLTSVPLEKLIKLGYSVPELEKMQSDSLCVIVTDEIPNPRMGVPLQWCIEKNSPPQVQIVDSKEQALKLIEEDGATQQQERRQRREEKEPSVRSSTEEPLGDKNNPKRREGSRNVVEGDYVEMNGKRRRRPPPPFEKQDGPQPVRKPRRQRRSDSEPSMERPKTPYVEENLRQDRVGRSDRKIQRKGVADEPTRRPRRERRPSGEGTAKQIYVARDPFDGIVENPSLDSRGDPPHPNSPLWWDYQTFKKLLRWETNLRLLIIGTDSYPKIKEETDWRLSLYHGWLWRLHDGWGSSIVPPSRYERARRIRRSMDMVNPDSVAGERMVDTRTSERRARRRETSRGPPRRR